MEVLPDDDTAALKAVLLRTLEQLLGAEAQVAALKRELLVARKKGK